MVAFFNMHDAFRKQHPVPDYSDIPSAYNHVPGTVRVPQPYKSKWPRVDKHLLVANLTYHYRKMVANEVPDEKCNSKGKNHCSDPESEESLVLKWPRDLSPRELAKCQEITKELRGNERLFFAMLLKRGNAEGHIQDFLGKVCAKTPSFREVLEKLIFVLHFPFFSD